MLKIFFANCIIILLMIMSISGQNCNLLKDSDSSENQQISINLNLLSQTQSELKLKLIIQNNKTEPVYFVTETKRHEGSVGPYLFLKTDDVSTLIVAKVLFSHPWDWYIENDKSRVKLEKLNSRNTYETEISIQIPAKETYPPYIENFGNLKKIDSSQIKKIDFRIGIFPYEKGITELIQKSPFFPYLVWNQQIENGIFREKSLYELQQVYTCDIELKKSI